MQLEKATLQVISSDAAASPIGDPIPVQFNPTTLRLEITNNSEGGNSRGDQDRQYTGKSSTKLSLDLIFDTADEGTTDSPVSVREKTQAVEQFVYPQGSGTNNEAPPKLRFQWGDLILEGLVDVVTLDFDHFAANGVPLRAKVGFSFKEQDRKYEFLQSGPGANASVGVSLAGGLSISAGLSVGVVGSVGVGLDFSAQAGIAIGGESAADFSARVGLDAEAWRGLSLDGGNPLSLEAGAQIGFSANISASAGLGFQAGASAGASVSLEGAFGLTAEAGVQTAASAGGNANVQQLFTVAAAGGVSAAIESVKTVKTATAQDDSRKAFGAPAGAPLPPTKPALPDQPRTAFQPQTFGSSDPAPAPPPPKADTRSTSFGFGVPLRSIVGAAADERAGSLSGSPRPNMTPQKGAATWPTTNDPTTPGWIALPTAPPSVLAGMRKKSSSCGCGCAGRMHK
jgi:hypothetical protein